MSETSKPDGITLTLVIPPGKLEGPDRILAGMMLIRQYEPDAGIAAEHDVIYYGSAATVERMKPEERAALEAWGWRTENDSWRHYV